MDEIHTILTEKLGVDERIILKWVFYVCGMKVWTGSFSLRIQFIDGLLKKSCSLWSCYSFKSKFLYRTHWDVVVSLRLRQYYKFCIFVSFRLCSVFYCKRRFLFLCSLWPLFIQMLLLSVPLRYHVRLNLYWYLQDWFTASIDHSQQRYQTTVTMVFRFSPRSYHCCKYIIYGLRNVECRFDVIMNGALGLQERASHQI